ncbi:heme-binding protein [Thioalkalivibrio sp. ALE19]|uniref:GlcG/HbpS family heme-binding protein n=1 Tax=Thioalkalivibrio sp. ALE19 TaxID=1266909 RepID=UPI00049104FB|nr:heme-binding protein [Thioalkalivibrio sp. ALE19]
MSPSIRSALLAGGLMTLAAAPVHADSATFNTPSLTPEIATKAVEAAVDACRDRNAQVTAAVVDRFGTTQALKRDRFAGPHTVGTAQSKAWTAVSFRTDTLELRDDAFPGEVSYGIQHLPNVTILGGGAQVTSDGRIVAGIGVSGSPSGEVDHQCAMDAIDAIQDDLL